MKIIHPYHIGFVVSDMQRSIDFYTNVLGMRVEREPVEVASSWLADVVGYEDVSIVLGMVGSRQWHVDRVAPIQEAERGPQRAPGRP